MNSTSTIRIALAGLGCLLMANQPAWARFAPVVCKTNMTQDAEITAGKQYATQVYGQQPVLQESDPVTKYIQQLGAKLPTPFTS